MTALHSNHPFSLRGFPQGVCDFHICSSCTSFFTDYFRTAVHHVSVIEQTGLYGILYCIFLLVSLQSSQENDKVECLKPDWYQTHKNQKAHHDTQYHKYYKMKTELSYVCAILKYTTLKDKISVCIVLPNDCNSYISYYGLLLIDFLVLFLMSS